MKAKYHVSVPVTAIGGPEEGERLKEGVVVVLVEPQDIHDDLLAVDGHGRLKMLLRLKRYFETLNKSFDNFAHR